MDRLSARHAAAQLRLRLHFTVRSAPHAPSGRSRDRGTRSGRPGGAVPQDLTAGAMTERLQKLLAASGHGSRRQIEEWIRAGRLQVNGHVAELGERADAGADIRLDGQPL